MEVLRLRVKSELLAYPIVTAKHDLSHICKLCCCLRQCGILNQLSEARGWTPSILMDTIWVFNLLSHNRNSKTFVFNSILLKIWLLIEVNFALTIFPFLTSLSTIHYLRFITIFHTFISSYSSWVLSLSFPTVWFLIVYPSLEFPNTLPKKED